eukprot:7678439-Ditylum_brightwellii.AAC.2
MKAISKKKREEVEGNSPKAYIMSLFKDKDLKKAIRAYVSSAEVINVVSPAKDAVKQALSVPYVAPKRQISTSIALLSSLNLPNNKTGGA